MTRDYEQETAYRRGYVPTAEEIAAYQANPDAEMPNWRRQKVARAAEAEAEREARLGVPSPATATQLEQARKDAAALKRHRIEDDGHLGVVNLYT